MALGDLSKKYESNGNPSIVSSGVDDLGGTWIPTRSDAYINITLPRPYPNTNYTLLNSCNTTRNTVGLSDRNPTARKVSNTTIQLDYYADREVAWMTVGVK